MQKEVISQKQFLEMLKNGARQFSNAYMQFFDVHHLKLHDISFENCDIMFCTFSDCDFRNVSFRNCKMYSGSFYTGTADNLSFEKCEIDMTLFDNFQFTMSRFHNCTLRWSAIFKSNLPNMSTSTRVKMFTDISQVTQKDIEDVTTEVMKEVGRLDIAQRKIIRDMLARDMDRYKFKDPGEKALYGAKESTGSDAPLAYGEVRQVVETFFYGAPQTYKTKKTYETDSKYKR